MVYCGCRYSFQDPDLVTFQGDFWFRPNNFTRMVSMDSRSRVAKAVVYGGLFKNGDDLSNTSNARLAEEFMGNGRVNAMWARARAGDLATHFRPHSWGDGVFIAPAVFTRADGDVAIFNYGPLAQTFHVRVSVRVHVHVPATVAGRGAGAQPKQPHCIDAWDGSVVPLDPGGAGTGTGTSTGNGTSTDTDTGTGAWAGVELAITVTIPATQSRLISCRG